MSIDWIVETHGIIPSTQSLLKEKASEGHVEGLVVQALEQTGGQGRHGREWVSPKGNLYLSILLRPSCSVSEAGQLSFLTSLAVAAVIDEYTHDKILKWPNDILVAGKKAAGILLETGLSKTQELEWLAVGVGLNIISAPADIGTALQDHTDEPLDLDDTRDTLLTKFNYYYDLWCKDGFAPIRRLWLDQAHKLGTPLQVKIGEKLEGGTFHDIDEAGNLLLQDESGKICKISAGDVYLACS